MSLLSAEPHSGADVLVVGEALVDIIERPGHQVTESVGGSPANVALGLGRLDAKVRLRTALANDARGSLIAQHLVASGVRLDDASWNLSRTSTAHATIGSDGSATYMFDVNWALDEVPERLGERVVHVGSISAFLPPGAERVADLVARLGDDVILTFDPNIRPALLSSRPHAVHVFESLAGRATLVKLSHEDAEWLYPGLPLNDIGSSVLALGSTAVVITLGQDGAIGFVGNHTVSSPAAPVKVKDTVGAGDTFTAALIDGLLSLDPLSSLSDDGVLESLLPHAIAAASVTVGRSGADLPRRADVERAERRIAIRQAVASIPPLA